MGMALIFGVMRIVNFTHGAFLMLGMYVSYVFFLKTGINPYVGFIVSGAILFVIGYAVYMRLLRRIPGQVDFMVILLTLGLGLIITDGVQLVFGADYHQINLPLLAINFRLGSQISVNAPWLLSFVFALFLAVLLYLVVSSTILVRDYCAILPDHY